MLILKGNFLILNFLAWLFAACLVALLVLGPGNCAQAAQAADAKAMEAKAPMRAPRRAPDAVATEFYGWYLETLSADQDPLSDRYDTFARYVAKELAARLVERLQGGRVPESDYFVQSASYRPTWLRSVRAATMRQRAATADVLVTLGDGSEESGPRQVLALSMVLENGAWKIRQVTSVDTMKSRSSPERPAI
jgi:hypothetical protein